MIVAYRSNDSVIRCVDSLLGEGIVTIVVVDNDPVGDGSSLRQALKERLSRITLVRPGQNLGYGGGINFGRGYLDNQCTLLLISNPDLEYSPGSVQYLASQLREHDLKAVGPKIVGDDDNTYPSARQFPAPLTAAMHTLLGAFFPNNPFSETYKMKQVSFTDLVTEVDWISGACILVDLSIFDNLGGFDEGYFMYVEDLDLCWRIAKDGGRVGYVPGAQVRHTQGTSTASHPYKMELAHYRSALRFCRKTQRRFFGLSIVPAGISLTIRLALVVTAKFARRTAGRYWSGKSHRVTG